MTILSAAREKGSCQQLLLVQEKKYTWGADKSLARPTSLCILFHGENISFDASLVIYMYININSTNIPPIMIINRIYETQNLLPLELVSFLVGLRTYQHPCMATESNLRLWFSFKNDRKKSSQKKKRGKERKTQKCKKRDLEEKRNGAKHRYKGRKERNIEKGTDK